MRNLYLSHLVEIADGSRHTIAIKQNLCHLLCSACLYTTVSSWIEQIAGFIKLFAFRLACGQSGVILWWSIPFSCMYSFDLFTRGGPLSLLTTRGIPWVEKILSNLEMIEFTDVERTISTSGNCDYASMTGNIYSPAGKGHRSPCTWYAEGLVVSETS